MHGFPLPFSDLCKCPWVPAIWLQPWALSNVWCSRWCLDYSKLLTITKILETSARNSGNMKNIKRWNKIFLIIPGTAKPKQSSITSIYMHCIYISIISWLPSFLSGILYFQFKFPIFFLKLLSSSFLFLWLHVSGKIST